MENQFLQKNDNFQLVDTIVMYLKYWQWFVLSIVVCCVLAYLYLQTVPKVYQRVAALQINEDSKPDAAVFGERSQFKAKVNVNNEIETLKSLHLAQEVVKRLNLDVSYMTKKGMKKVDLYTQSPVVALFPDSIDKTPLSFQLKLLPDNMVQLSDFVLGDSKIDQTIKVRLSEKTLTPAGNIIIFPSSHYSTDLQQPIEVSKSNIRTVSRMFAESLTVFLSSKENTVILLEMEDVSTQRAEDFLNTLISVYNENCLKAIVTALQFVNGKIVVAKNELDSIDSKLELFKRQNLVTDFRDAGSQNRKEYSDYSRKAQEAQTQINIAKSIQKDLKNVNKRWDLLPTNMGLNHQAIELSIAQHNDLIQKRNRLMVDSGEKNPVFVELNNSISSLRQSISQTIDNLIKTNTMQLKSFQSQADMITTQLASNPEQERELQSIELEQSIKKDVYLYLLKEREDKQMALVTTTNSQIISMPSGNSAPVRPKKMKIMLAAFMIGTGIPFSIIWGKNLINTTVRGKDLKDFPIPSLGTIPLVEITDSEKLILVESQDTNAINESFRSVRFELDRTCKPNLKVILFTSMEPGCGKTFISANIAKSFALAEKRIVLLDMDMRTASLSKFINSPDWGISDILRKHLYTPEGYNYDGFDIIPVGSMPPNPSELLMSDQLKPLIEKLRDEYDYVFIDSTPIDLFHDARIIGQYADLSIFVLSENYTDRRKLTELKNIFHNREFKNMRVILNCSEQQQPSEIYNAYYEKISKPQQSRLKEERYSTGLLLPKTQKTGRKSEID